MKLEKENNATEKARKVRKRQEKKAEKERIAAEKATERERKAAEKEQKALQKAAERVRKTAKMTDNSSRIPLRRGICKASLNARHKGQA